MSSTGSSAGLFKCVLVPVDLSDDSVTALEVAQQRFADPRATLVIVHAIEAPESVNEYVALPLRDQVVSAQVSDVQRQLKTLANAHHEGWQEVHVVTELGKPADVIPSVAHTWHADLIVMGSHGKGGLFASLFSGTAEHVASKLACSIFVLRPSATA